MEGTPRPLRVALGEYDIGWHDPETSLERARALVADAARAGARLVVLPEMATTGFTMDTTQATPLAGGHSARLSAVAAEAGVWLVASVAATEPSASGSAGSARKDGTRAVNAAIVVDPTGAIVAVYRKQKLFAFAGEHEHYAPGSDKVVVTIDGVRIAPLVCYDLRFPELFRALAREVDAFILVANWPAARRLHWDTLTRARAIENQAYVVAVNRVGTGGAITYDGGSIAWDPWGDPVPEARSPSGIRLVTVDPARVADVRGRYPFLKDLTV
jgi:predicted amidohydrolase